jgi:protein O-GlcNAc transferase
MTRKTGRDDELGLCRKTLQSEPGHAEALHRLGLLLFQSGDHGPALRQISRSVMVQPSNPLFRNNLGNALRERGGLAPAAANCRHALALLPDYADAHFNLAAVLQAQGRHEGALVGYRRALLCRPDFAEARNNLGYGLGQAGRLSEAISLCGSAIILRPDLADPYNNLANIMKDRGSVDSGLAFLRRALLLRPADARLHNNLGNVLDERGDLDGAAAAYWQAIRLQPAYAEAHSNLGILFASHGGGAQAMPHFQRALCLRPDLAAVHNNLGGALQDLGAPHFAVTCHRHAVLLAPAYDEAWGNLGNALRLLGRFAEAVHAFRLSLSLNPGSATLLNNLGNAVKDQGRLEDSILLFSRAVAADPGFLQAHSNLLFGLSFDPRCGPERYLAEARIYGGRVAARARPFADWPALSGGPKPLKVGFVSADLRNHPVAYFLESLLAKLDGTRIEATAYACLKGEDDCTVRLKSLFKGWHSISGLSDQAAAAMIRDHGMHILVDLSGHTADNRLPLFAWKPAPVQVSWLGYFASTGVPGMDYLLADSQSVPQSRDGDFTETVWRLPGTRLCFTPPAADSALPVSALPALSRGYVTFGCFQALGKLNDRVLAVWGRIMAALPGARLRLQNKQITSSAERRALRSRLAAAGIAPERVTLAGAVSRHDYLAAHADIDIILDSFPYPGGTTTCEALWMGVPTLTLAGQNMLSRQGASLLGCVGLEDWVAQDEADYVGLAVDHASDLDRMAALRAALRSKALASPLFDAAGFARNLEQAFISMMGDRLAVNG